LMHQTQGIKESNGDHSKGMENTMFKWCCGTGSWACVGLVVRFRKMIRNGGGRMVRRYIVRTMLFQESIWEELKVFLVTKILWILGVLASAQQAEGG
jgi:hypothetical protein